MTKNLKIAVAVLIVAVLFLGVAYSDTPFMKGFVRGAFPAVVLLEDSEFMKGFVEGAAHAVTGGAAHSQSNCTDT